MFILLLTQAADDGTLGEPELFLHLPQSRAVAVALHPPVIILAGVAVELLCHGGGAVVGLCWSVSLPGLHMVKHTPVKKAGV